MIRIEREPLKFLLRGRIIAVQLDKQPRYEFKKTRTYAVALVGRRSSTCRVQVLEADGLTLRIRHAPDAEDVPRTLRRGYGYIGDDVAGGSDPLDAGECLPAGVTTGIAEESRRRFEQMRAEEKLWAKHRSLALRLRAAARDRDFKAVEEIRRELDAA